MLKIQINQKKIIAINATYSLISVFGNLRT